MGNEAERMTPVELRRACATLDVNYTELAKLLRVSPVTVSMWARGEYRIPYTAEVFIRRLLDEAETSSEGSERDANIEPEPAG